MVSDGVYKIQCGESVSDGGQLNAKGDVLIIAGRASGALRLDLIVSSESAAAPEAEQHVLPSLKLDGFAELRESPLSSIDHRPPRIALDLTPTNWSMKGRVTSFKLLDNNAPDDGDDETSSLIFDHQSYAGICKIEKK